MMVSMSWVHFHSFGGLQTDLDKIVHSSFLISVSGFVSALHFLTLPWAATASMALRTVSSSLQELHGFDWLQVLVQLIDDGNACGQVQLHDSCNLTCL